MENKCETAGFQHSWKDITPNIVYATYPAQYPPRQESCVNCGLKRTFHEKVEKWITYSDGVERAPVQEGSVITIIGNGLTASTSAGYCVNATNTSLHGKKAD